MSAVRFDVEGVPAPKGSARAVRNRHTGRAMLLASSSPKNERDQKSWADAVGWSARIVWAGRAPMDGELFAVLEFRFARPKSHTKAQRASPWHTSKPDRDKIERCTLDAMTGIIYRDDAQICDGRTIKRYCVEGETPGASITIEPASAGIHH